MAKTLLSGVLPETVLNANYLNSTIVAWQNFTLPELQGALSALIVSSKASQPELLQVQIKRSNRKGSNPILAIERTPYVCSAESTCDPCEGTDTTPLSYQEEIELTKQLCFDVTVDIDLDKYMNSGKDFDQLIMEAIQKQLSDKYRLAMDKLNRDIAAFLYANKGTWGKNYFTNDVPLFNLTNPTSSGVLAGAINLTEVARWRNAFAKINTTPNDIVVIAGNSYDAIDIAQQNSGVNNGGVNTSGVLNIALQRDYVLDNASYVPDANKYINLAIRRGTAQLVTYAPISKLSNLTPITRQNFVELTKSIAQGSVALGGKLQSVVTMPYVTAEGEKFDFYFDVTVVKVKGSSDSNNPDCWTAAKITFNTYWDILLNKPEGCDVNGYNGIVAFKTCPYEEPVCSTPYIAPIMPTPALSCIKFANGDSCIYGQSAYALNLNGRQIPLNGQVLNNANDLAALLNRVAGADVFTVSGGVIQVTNLEWQNATGYINNGVTGAFSFSPINCYPNYCVSYDTTQATTMGLSPTGTLPADLLLVSNDLGGVPILQIVFVDLVAGVYRYTVASATPPTSIVGGAIAVGSC